MKVVFNYNSSWMVIDTDDIIEDKDFYFLNTGSHQIGFLKTKTTLYSIGDQIDKQTL